MSNQIKIVLSFLAFIIAVHFFIVPFFHKRQATRTVEAVLGYWQTNDLVPSFKYWIKEEASPPVYGVVDYEILEKSFVKEGSQWKAFIVTHINFSSGNFLKSGKWAFHLEHTKKGWKITSFQRLKN